MGTSKVLKEVVSVRRLLLGSLVGSLSLGFLFFSFNSVELFIVKVVLSVLIILSTFGRKNFFRNFCYFYLLSIILGGGLYLFDINLSYQNRGVLFVKNGLGLNLILVLICAPIIIYLFVKENIKYKSIYSDKYVVEIYINDQKYMVEGMVDTGNQLVDPYKRRSIILVDLDIDLGKMKYIYVPYKALNTSGVIPCFSPDRVIVGNKIFSNCLVGISKDKFFLNGASCILPNKFKEELL